MIGPNFLSPSQLNHWQRASHKPGEFVSYGNIDFVVMKAIAVYLPTAIADILVRDKEHEWE